MQMLKNIFNSEKKYFLELDDSKIPQPVKQAVKTAEKVADMAQNQAEKVADMAQNQAEKVADIVQDKVESKPVQKAVQNGKQAVDQAVAQVDDAKSKAKAVKKSVKKSASEAPKTTKPKTPQEAGASSYDPPFWVAAMYKNNTSKVNSDGTPAEQTFATDNLMPIATKSRRTPGPSLNKFKNMARQTKAFKG